MEAGWASNRHSAASEVASSWQPAKPEFRPGAAPDNIGGRPWLYRSSRVVPVDVRPAAPTWPGDPQVVRCHGNLLTVEIAAVNYGFGLRKNQGVVGRRIEFADYDGLDVPECLLDCPEDLRGAATDRDPVSPSPVPPVWRRRPNGVRRSPGHKPVCDQMLRHPRRHRVLASEPRALWTCSHRASGDEEKTWNRQAVSSSIQLSINPASRVAKAANAVITDVPFTKAKPSLHSRITGARPRRCRAFEAGNRSWPRRA
jgi:hypothetical protein